LQAGHIERYLLHLGVLAMASDSLANLSREELVNRVQQAEQLVSVANDSLSYLQTIHHIRFIASRLALLWQSSRQPGRHALLPCFYYCSGSGLCGCICSSNKNSDEATASMTS